MIRWREQTTPTTASHLRGIIETVWSGAEQFLAEYYGPDPANPDSLAATTLKRLMAEYRKIK
jgi:hypothetical protein